MTQRLYYDHNAVECEATVLACRKGENGFEALLDATVIYPEGGGQPSDTGYLNDAHVTYAFEEGDGVWHRCEREFLPGETVRVRFDEAVRRDHCQQHTGEHILSGVAKRLYGCVNVGFHLAEEYVSIDLDKPLSDGQVDALELAANEAIQKNEPTTYRLVDGAELENIELRKRAKGLAGEIRIVYAGGVDSCTCCGTHCARAGEVGALKVLSHMNYKGGARIFFLCGMRAVRSMMEEREHLGAVARRFSTKPAEAVQAVFKQGEELAELRRALKKRTEELFDYKARALHESAEKTERTGVAAIVALTEGVSVPELGALCEKLCARGRTVAILLSQNGEQLVYRMARSADVDLSMREVCQAVNAATGGKGGGRDDAAQGSAPMRSDAQEIRAQLENYLKSRLRAVKV